jgi:hypothetical protein
MDENDLKPVSFRASAEEIEAIDRGARENGLSRSDFIRQRLSNPSEPQANTVAGSGQPSKDTTVLLQHVLYGLHCVHAAVYAIAETSGAVTTAQAAKITEGSKKASRDFLAHLDERIATVRQQIKPAEPEARINKTVQEIKADGVSRSV